MRLLGASLVLITLACSGEQRTAGFNQPVRLENASFRDGELPGLPPLDAAQVNAGVHPTAPAITSISLASSSIPLGETGRAISGRASLGAAAVGVRLLDAGSGYWLVPTGSADVINEGEVEWRLQAAFSAEGRSGLQRLRFAAIDADGRSGTQGELQLCLLPEVPDGGNACDPKTAPPALVVSLAWDAPVDLDLRVVAPDGRVADPKHPSLAPEDSHGKLDLKAPGVGSFDRDAFSDCSAGPRREDFVFQSDPAPGTYLIYVNLYDSCGEPDVHFDVTLHVPTEGPEPGTYAVAESFRQSGQLEAAQENGGTQAGSFVTSFIAR